MKVRVLLFGPAALAHGGPHVEFDAPGDARLTASSLLGALGREHPALAPFASAGRLAIDGVYAAPGDVVPAGAETALIAMVSGG